MKMLGIWMKYQPSMSLSEIDVIEHPIFTKSGRPKTAQEPDGYEYQVTGLLASELSFRERKLSEKGLFMLATNDCSDTLTMAKMLELYKSQQSVEKGFRLLKSPDFLTSSLYLN